MEEHMNDHEVKVLLKEYLNTSIDIKNEVFSADL